MRRLIVIPFILFTLSLLAAPIGEQRAREMAMQFFASGQTRSSAVVLEMEWADSDIGDFKAVSATSRNSTITIDKDVDDALIYIYNRVDAKGFVVIAGDDKAQRPIVAFSFDNTFDVENMPDAARAILQAWCRQIAAVRVEKRLSSVTRADDISVGNVVVSYKTAQWNQSAPFNTYTPIVNGVQSLTGCVATAASILCRYYEWPSSGVGTTPQYTYKDVDGVSRTVPANTLGRNYDYSKMKMDYSGGYTSAEGNMVASLMYDIGTALKMQYSMNSSSAHSSDVVPVMSQYFGYSKGALYISHSGISEHKWTQMLQQNLQQYGPMIYRGASSDVDRHAFVLDAYTDKDYFSINYGWGGSSNGYYLLPNNHYYIKQEGVFYFEPDKDGTSEYKDYLTLVSFVASSGNVYRGLYTNAVEPYQPGVNFMCYCSVKSRGVVSFYGDLCVAHCDKAGNIKSVLVTIDHKTTPLGGDGKGYRRNISLVDAIEEGDRLCGFYKGVNSDEWVRMVRDQDGDYDEVILWATPEQVASSLNLEYDKSDNSLTFTSEHAIQYAVTNASGSVVRSGNVASHTPTAISLEGLESGNYTFSFASGGSPYNLSVIL